MDSLSSNAHINNWIYHINAVFLFYCRLHVNRIVQFTKLTEHGTKTGISVDHHHRNQNSPLTRHANLFDLLDILDIHNENTPMQHTAIFHGSKNEMTISFDFSSPEPKAYRRAYSIPKLRRPSLSLSSSLLSSSTIFKRLLL